MISFYNSQATTSIRAEPKDVIACMQSQGVKVLKEALITDTTISIEHGNNQPATVYTPSCFHVRETKTL